MLTKRIIPCLDVLNTGRVVKGINFKKFKDAGNPFKLAKRYYEEGADELVFLDINTQENKRDYMLNLIEKTAKNIFIPLTVGGGIRNIGDIRNALKAGADKVSINKIAVTKPGIISRAANIFGSQCIVLSVDALQIDPDKWAVCVHGGKINTGIDLILWLEEAVARGVGEILLTSIDHDGTKKGYNIKLLETANKAVSVPIIASGGAGREKDFFDAFKEGGADAALAASLFHFDILKIKKIKSYLKKRDIPIRTNYEEN